MHFQWEILGIIPKRLERISSFDLYSESEKIKLRKKSNRGFSVWGKEQDRAAHWVLGGGKRKGKSPDAFLPRCWWPRSWAAEGTGGQRKAERGGEVVSPHLSSETSFPSPDGREDVPL